MSKTKWICAIITLVYIFALSSAHAAVAPEITRLLTLQTSLFSTEITADNNGNIYIADVTQGVIRIYNFKGALLKTFKLDFKPTCLSVSPSGYLYIGGKGRIDIYSGSIFVNSYKGIVERPLSIAFLNGKTYIADGYWVKVFDSSMNKISEFGGYAGSDNIQRNGRFTDLKEIAVDYANSLLFVLDRGAIANEGNYGSTYVWRVQVFDENGNFVRSFSNYGFGVEGKVGSASSIAVDKEARVYVADNQQNIIVVYDSYGTYLKTIYDNQNPIYNPTGLYYHSDRLYAASGLAKAAYVFGIDLYGLLRVEPLGLEFSSQGGNTVSGTLNIFNDGKGDLNFIASASEPWISLSSSAGVVATGSSVLINVMINSSGLSTGTYSGTIEITSNGGSETIPVTLHVLAPPVLTVSPSSFDLIKKKGSPSDPLIVNITLSNDLSGSMAWTASSDSSWLKIIPSTGPSNSTVSANIIVDTNIDPGKYTGIITVSAQGAEGSPATITVNLEIRTSRKIAVNANIETAAFTISGPASYEGSGLSYVIEDVPSGTYTVHFKPVKGYKTPSPQSGTLLDEGELLFSGEYQPLGDRLHIIASHGPGNKDNMEIRIFNGDGQLLKTIAPVKPYRYGATTATGDINGDGINELIIGTGPGAKVPPLVTVIDIDGKVIGEFRPFSGLGYGVEVAAADLDGDGSAEIITAKTSKFAGTPLVDLKVFKFMDGRFINKGVRLEHKGANGIRITAADLNNDGIPEVLVIPASGEAPVYIYQIDTSQQEWTASLILQYTGCDNSGGSNLTAGDIDADGIPEIILSCHYDSGTLVRIINASGNPIKEFSTGSSLKDFIAAGDLDNDGIAEIILGDGPAAHKRTVKIFNPEGGLLRSFNAFEDSFGIRISTGRFE